VTLGRGVAARRRMLLQVSSEIWHPVTYDGLVYQISA
jgi:hypothetical protein